MNSRLASIDLIEPSDEFDCRVAGMGAIVKPLKGDITTLERGEMESLARKSLAKREAVAIVGHDESGVYLWKGITPILNKAYAAKLDG